MKFISFAILLGMTLFFLVTGCKAPPPPSAGAPPQAFTGRNTNRGGPPDKAKSLTVCCPSIKETKGMIFDKSTEADTFTVRGMKCIIELTRNETASVDVVVKKSNSVLFFGTGFQVRSEPGSYQTAYKITFTYPGFKDVVFTDVPILAKKIEVPMVVFQDAK